eukprot:TRINITY_DN4379_c0_g1_i1.p1 TRINITY_DN4379_c0_g1~~TRINITY_DN4379_c0_g1_i1.p1  ORF type:complete len:388 (-),score=19.73 TRINITY_DN4379_c0_g1_i1:59-1222(-)
MPHRRSAASENKIRLYWAIFRIFIALTSSGFFLYFLVQQIENFLVMESIQDTVKIGHEVIDWVHLSLDEERCAVSLMRNITTPIEELAQSVGTYSYEKLEVIQYDSFVALNAVIASCDEAHYITSERSILLYSISELQEMHKHVQEHPYFWDEPFYQNYTSALHSVRMTLLDIISKNVNYIDETIARQSIVLQSIYYFMENVGLMRDAIIMLPTKSGLEWWICRDSVISYYKGMSIYARAMNQRIVGTTRDIYEEALHSYEWQRCNKTIDMTIRDSTNASFTLDIEEWFNCTTTLIYKLRPLADDIHDHLGSASSNFQMVSLTALVICVVGICLEAIAAGTLIQQAIPVILLYSRFSAVVHSASISTRSGSKELTAHNNPQSNISDN